MTRFEHAIATQSHGVISSLYQRGHFSSAKDRAEGPSLRVTRYRVYSATGQLVKQTDDIKVARNSERMHRGSKIMLQTSKGVYVYA